MKAADRIRLEAVQPFNRPIVICGLIFEFASCDLHDQHSVADYIGETLLAFGASGHYVIPSTTTDIDRQLRKPIMATWVKCTDENGQTIYANLDNAITLFRDDVRHRGTVIAFMGSANGATVVSDTPDQILQSAKG
jgi:hypothetical protein